jgi:hypothetical protein
MGNIPKTTKLYLHMNNEETSVKFKTVVFINVHLGYHLYEVTQVSYFSLVCFNHDTIG